MSEDIVQVVGQEQPPEDVDLFQIGAPILVALGILLVLGYLVKAIPDWPTRNPSEGK